MTIYEYPPLPDGVAHGSWISAIDAIRGYCGWHIAPVVTETVTVDGSGTWEQLLPTLRLVALNSITNDGAAVLDPEWSTSGIVRGAWTRRYRGVVANMTHGYSEWPAELLSLAGDAVAAAGRGGVSSVTSRAHQVRFNAATLVAALGDGQQSTLDRYRLVRLG